MDVNLDLFNGIERDYDFRRRYAMDNEKIILFMGRLVYEKGIQHLIAAMPKILAGYNDAKLVIGGQGGMIDELRAQARNLGIEAMLAENPVVVSDIGGLNEIVEHRRNGMKSYTGNANSLADSILELLYDHKLCAEVVKRAKNKVRNDYNWSKIAQDTHFTYQKAICQSMAEKQKRQLEQERARKTQKTKKGRPEREVTNLLSFKKRQAYA